MTALEALKRDNLNDSETLLEKALESLDTTKKALKEKLLEIDELDEKIALELSNSTRALKKIKILLDEKKQEFFVKTNKKKG